MKVLLTGSFGNLGLPTLKNLLRTDHEVTCLDVENKNNKRKYRSLRKINDFKIIWGSITNRIIVEEAIKDKDCIIHLAGLTPPFTEEHPDIANSVNIHGSKNILDGLEKMSLSPKFIFSSSFSVYGPQLPDSQPKNVNDPVFKTDIYTSQKLEIENLLISSNLSWIIFRIAAAPSLSLRHNQMDLLYELPIEQQVDFIHPEDAGYAIAKSVDLNVERIILNLGGGKSCQLTNREFLGRYLNVLGIGLPAEEAFKQPIKNEDWYYSSWLNSDNTQKLLEYQNHSFEDFLNQVKKRVGFLAIIIRPFSKSIKRYLAKKSPYYEENMKRKKLSL